MHGGLAAAGRPLRPQRLSGLGGAAGGSLFSLTGARAFSGWAAGQVFQNFFAGSFRDQIAASITAGGVVDLSGIAQRYAGFLPESFRASIVEACERSVSAVLSDNAVVLALSLIHI